MVGRNWKKTSVYPILCVRVLWCTYDSTITSDNSVDITIAKQLEEIWLEKGGGGNSLNLIIYLGILQQCIHQLTVLKKRGKRLAFTIWWWRSSRKVLEVKKYLW